MPHQWQHPPRPALVYAPTLVGSPGTVGWWHHWAVYFDRLGQPCTLLALETGLAQARARRDETAAALAVLDADLSERAALVARVRALEARGE